MNIFESDPAKISSNTLSDVLTPTRLKKRTNGLKASPSSSLKFIKKHSKCSTPVCTETPSPSILNSPPRKSLTGRPPLSMPKPNSSKNQNISTLKLISPKDFVGISKNAAINKVLNVENYEFIQKIGQGAYSIVSKALCKVTGKLVAIKSYDKLGIFEGNGLNFKEEVKILSKIDHKGIVKLIESIETASQLHIIMEYIPGTSLYGYLKRCPNARIPEPEAKAIFSQISSALYYLHSNNITHGDLKLENLLVTQSNEVKLIDFGFADFSEKKKAVFCGTSSYLSPEIIGLQEYFGRPADVWALGVILYTILTGTFPFKGINEQELYKRIQKGCIHIPEFVSSEARRLIEKMLQNEAKHRPTLKQIIKDPWLNTSENFEPEENYKLSLSSSFIKENFLRFNKRTANPDKSLENWGAHVKSLLKVD